MNSSGEKKRQAEYRDFKNRDFLIGTVKQCQNGDTEAMENIYIAYKSSLFNLIYRFTGDFSLAEDLLQDIFVKVFTNIKGLRSPDAFNSWLYRITINACMSFGRKKGKRKEVPINELEKTGHGHIDNDKNQIRQQLEQAIAILPPKQKIVFQLHDVQGYTNAEIAGIMRCSEGTAKSQLFKARMKIRNFLRGI